MIIMRMKVTIHIAARKRELLCCSGLIFLSAEWIVEGLARRIPLKRKPCEV